MNTPIQVLLLDDHPLFRVGLSTAFKQCCCPIEVVAEAESMTHFFQLIPTVQIDVALLDILLPDGSGIQVARFLRIHYPMVKILILSADNTPETIKELIEIGVDGFVSKTISLADLCHAVEYISNGAQYYGPDIVERIHSSGITSSNALNLLVEFTERENEIIHYCCLGYSAKEVAEQLSVSTCTVNTHKNNIFKKLGINNSVELVRYALKNGIIVL